MLTLDFSLIEMNSQHNRGFVEVYFFPKVNHDVFVVNHATMVIRIEEEKQEYTQGFTWFGSVPTSKGTGA